MFDYGYKEDAILNLRDSMKGIVRDQSGFGLYIDLQMEDEMTGEYQGCIPVFGYWTASVPRGTEVTCSVKRWAKEGKYILVNVDSVEYDKSVEKAA